MNTRTLVSMSLLILLVGLSGAGTGHAGKKAKVEICHVNNGAVGVVAINISPNALEAHLKHGDYYPLSFYEDTDGDGYGDSSIVTTGCRAPTGYVAAAGDCDTSEAAVNPGAAEVCDNWRDDNCDGQIDEGCAVCGDLVLQYGEPCDEGPYSATCDPDCTTVSCGDGTINLYAGELCDPPTSQCTSSCLPDPPGLVGLDISCSPAGTAHPFGIAYPCKVIGTYTSGPPVDLSNDPALKLGSHDMTTAQFISTISGPALLFVAKGEAEVSAVHTWTAGSAVIVGGDSLAPPASTWEPLQITPASVTIAPGETAQFRLYYTDPLAPGNPVDITFNLPTPGTRPYVAGAENVLVASVGNYLKVSGTKLGTARVHAVFYGVAVAADVTVAAP